MYLKLAQKQVFYTQKADPWEVFVHFDLWHCPDHPVMKRDLPVQLQEPVKQDAPPQPGLDSSIARLTDRVRTNR